MKPRVLGGHRTPLSSDQKAEIRRLLKTTKLFFREIAALVGCSTSGVAHLNEAERIREIRPWARREIKACPNCGAPCKRNSGTCSLKCRQDGENARDIARKARPPVPEEVAAKLLSEWFSELRRSQA